MNSKLNSALEALKKNGIRVYDEKTIPECEVIPTGSLIFNQVMNGGFHTRRLEMICAREGVGKSVLSYTAINNALHKFEDSVAILLDIECRADIEWISKFVTEDVIARLLILREEYIENAGNTINKIIKQLNNIHISIIVVDSIAAANTARYKDADMETQQIGGNAMGVGKFVRSMVQIAEKNNTAVVLLNQIRDDIGSYGPSIGHVPGGMAMKHACDATYYLRNLSQKDTKDLATNGIEEKTDLGEVQQLAVGVAIKCLKGKNWSQTAKSLFYRRATENNNVGYDTLNEVFRLALANSIITKNSEYGSTFYYSKFPLDEKSGKNQIVDKKNVLLYLKNNKECFEDIKNNILNSGIIKDQVEQDDFTEEY